MASFSRKYPLAHHVFPLHRARTLWRAGRLRGKRDLAAEGQPRRTTSAVDRALGLENFVHLYLTAAGARFEKLPILGAQLSCSSISAFPHAVLELATAKLEDSECRICNWNIAVSRPQVPGICKGGNWTRGTNPSRIAQVWRGFKESSPSLKQARGFWKPGVLVPLLNGAEIRDNLSLLSLPRRQPELLLESGVEISRFSRVIVFSNADLDSLRLAGHIPGELRVELETFEGYGENSVEEELRVKINGILQERRADASLDFDKIRARKPCEVAG